MGRKGQNKVKKLKNHQTKDQLSKRNELLSLADKLIALTTVISKSPPSLAKLWETHLQIQATLDKMKLIESECDTCGSVGNRTRESLDAFLTFMAANGAQFKNITLDTFAGYDVGAKTLQPVASGQPLMTIPRTLMMSTEGASASVLGPMVEHDAILQNMPNISLALYLLLEKFTENSFWKPYLDVLPATYTTVVYFSLDELQELKGSPLMEATLKQCKNIARQYAYFKKLFLSSDYAVVDIFRDKFTYEEYRWAVSTVMTRQNKIPAKDGGEMISALIPLWDMCNHTNGDVSTDYNPTLNRSECAALRDFKAGEQVFIFYGIRTNAEMFLHNGFVYADNEHDGYWLRLGVSKSDPLLEIRKTLLLRLSLPVQGDFFLRPGIISLEGPLIAFVKVFVMNENELHKLVSADETTTLENLNSPLESDLTKRAFNFLGTRLRLLLAAYPTTLDDDLAVLKEQNISDCKKVTVELRVLEKKILQQAIECIKNASMSAS